MINTSSPIHRPPRDTLPVDDEIDITAIATKTNTFYLHNSKTMQDSVYLEAVPRRPGTFVDTHLYPKSTHSDQSRNPPTCTQEPTKGYIEEVESSDDEAFPSSGSRNNSLESDKSQPLGSSWGSIETINNIDTPNPRCQVS